MATLTKNMHLTQPKNFRTPKYGEHRCLIFKDGQYVGTLYLNSTMRKIWRANNFQLTIMDI